MGWAEAIAAIFKVVGYILDAHAKGQLSQERLDAVIANLKPVPPPTGTPLTQERLDTVVAFLQSSIPPKKES